MTCEIAVANRLGIVLAADSAVTFRKDHPEGPKTLYSSGANKILQALTNEPVAWMVYDSASFAELPWELVIKSFRAVAAPEQRLGDYMSRFIEFIEASWELFPEEVRQGQTNHAIGAGVRRVLDSLIEWHPVTADLARPLPERQAVLPAFIARCETLVDGTPLPDGLDPADLERSLQEDALQLAPPIEQFLRPDSGHLLDVLPMPDLMRLAVKVAFKLPREVFGALSGVVIAGFGSSEVLPSFVERHFYGFLGRRVFSVERTSRAVARQGVGAFVEAFAQKGMVETFTQGISPEAWTQGRTAFSDQASALVERAVALTAGAAVPPGDLTRLVGEARELFLNQWATATLGAHLNPLLDAVAALPMDQLAELGENLVMLESLKERVTQRTQSVGGPIDVAVITKGEGLVWIKRKHYFRPELNSRYFTRQRERGTPHA